MQHHNSGHWKGWALKISTFLGPRNDVALLKTITYHAIKTTGTLIVIIYLKKRCYPSAFKPWPWPLRIKQISGDGGKAVHDVFKGSLTRDFHQFYPGHWVSNGNHFTFFSSVGHKVCMRDIKCVCGTYIDTPCSDHFDQIFYRERASQLARKQAKEKLKESVEEELITEGEGRWWPGWQGISAPPPCAHSWRRDLHSQPVLTPPPFSWPIWLVSSSSGGTPWRPRPRGSEGWRFKEEASLTNFLFYGFLIKGLGAEISANIDCRKFGRCQRCWVRQRFDHFKHGGPVQQAGIYGTGENAPIKPGQRELIPHLETTCTRFNINKEENVLISGTREKSAVADSAEPKQ